MEFILEFVFHEISQFTMSNIIMYFGRVFDSQHNIQDFGNQKKNVREYK